MAKTLTLARNPAPTPSPADTLTPEAIQHAQAARVWLEKALQALNGDTCTAADIHAAMGRTSSAIRSLKRACEAVSTNTTSKGA